MNQLYIYICSHISSLLHLPPTLLSLLSGHHWSAFYPIESFLFPRILYKQNHRVYTFVCFWPGFFIQHNYFKIHPCCSMISIVYFFVFAAKYSIVWLYHNLFIYSPVDGNWVVAGLGPLQRSCHQRSYTNLCMTYAFTLWG